MNILPYLRIVQYSHIEIVKLLCKYHKVWAEPQLKEQ